LKESFVGGIGMSRTYGLYAPDKKRNLKKKGNKKNNDYTESEVRIMPVLSSKEENWT
jgi:hypothetical protein